MLVATVIGNRPQLVKAAAVSGVLRDAHREVVIHTGQHYDDELSGVFVRDLELAAPDFQLGLGGGSNTAQTAAMLAALEPLLIETAPDVVMVYGDTNSTLAGALAGAQLGLRVAHVEAGMRSFDRTMPEELNRVVTDHLSDLLLCSSESALANAHAERVPGIIEVVGDVMVDVALALQPRARERADVLERFGVRPQKFLLATLHRAGNVDQPERLRAAVALLGSLPDPMVLPLHPRTRARLREAGLLEQLAARAGVTLCGPLGYLEFTALLCNSRAILTDSGGVQKEAYLAGVPCVTMRDRTEWEETVSSGWNTLVDLDADAARAALLLPVPARRSPLYGDGRAGERVVRALERLAAGPARGRRRGR